MKHHLYALFFLLTTAHYVQGQSYIILAREPKAEHWKYYNLKGEVVIDKQYPAYYRFSEDGFALVGKNVFTILNRKGDEIKTDMKVIIYDDHHYIAAFYSDGLVVTRSTHGFGCLDTLGKIAVPHEYSLLTEFHDGYAVGISKRKSYVVNRLGSKTIIADSTIVKAKAFHENLAAFVTKGGQWGFVDTNGSIAIKPQLDRVGNFSHGLAWARNELDLVGFIDKKGNWIIEPKFSAANNFDPESGLARVKCDGCPRTTDTGDRVWTYIDVAGQVQQFSLPNRIDDFSEGLALSSSDNLVGYINNKGEWAIKPQFEGGRYFENGYAWVKNGLWGLIDKQGNWVIEPKFEAVKDISRINK